MKPLMLVANIFCVVGIIAIIVLWLLLLAHLTGHDKRAYKVISPFDQVLINGKEFTLNELADLYRPYYYLRNTDPSLPLLWLWHEAVLTDTTLDLIYYAAWEDEVNPNPTIDKAYALFRSAFYGYPTRDIEFLQVSVSKETGEVAGLLFETSPGDEYMVVLSSHLVARYLRQPDGKFTEIRATRSGQELSRTPGMEVLFKENHPQILVQTWNHLSRLYRTGDSDCTELAPPLKNLTETEYRSYKFARKSQGDYKTSESRWTLPVAILSTLVFVTFPSRLLQALKKKKSEG